MQRCAVMAYVAEATGKIPLYCTKLLVSLILDQYFIEELLLWPRLIIKMFVFPKYIFLWFTKAFICCEIS